MTRSSVEADRVGPYLALLFLMLSSATLFEGFDAAMLSFAAPDARASLDIDREEWGYVNGITRMGVMASFFFCSSPTAWAPRDDADRARPRSSTG
jgi:hypothetical protein